MELLVQKAAIRYSLHFLRQSIPSIEQTIISLPKEDPSRYHMEELLMEQKADLATFEALADEYLL